jgi:hypothetical protein
MEDQTGTKVSTEEASTNLYWTFGNEEVFNLQTTVRGAINDAQISAHLASVKAAMKAIVQLGGHAKQVGAGSAVTSSPSVSASQFEFYKGNKGKTYIKLNGAAEPNEITCPTHNAKMKRRTNDEGSWYSHKAPDDKWCSVSVPGKQD